MRRARKCKRALSPRNRSRYGWSQCWPGLSTRARRRRSFSARVLGCAPHPVICRTPAWRAWSGTIPSAGAGGWLLHRRTEHRQASRGVDRLRLKSLSRTAAKCTRCRASFRTHLLGVFDNPGGRFEFAAERNEGARRLLEYCFAIPKARSVLASKRLQPESHEVGGTQR
jgi:hypothetical protein